MVTVLRDNIDWGGHVEWTLRDFHSYQTDRGVTYNAYLIRDEKTALIDTVKAPFLVEGRAGDGRGGHQGDEMGVAARNDRRSIFSGRLNTGRVPRSRSSTGGPRAAGCGRAQGL